MSGKYTDYSVGESSGYTDGYSSHWSVAMIADGSTHYSRSVYSQSAVSMVYCSDEYIKAQYVVIRYDLCTGVASVG